MFFDTLQTLVISERQKDPELDVEYKNTTLSSASSDKS